ncbi:hypothetical protein CMI37_31115 [Candidatus Pacearchaeota archaeon]|nr:hypothetical protein [Candidatus Pacearchaeota archaeon]
MSSCRSEIIGYMKVRFTHLCCGAEETKHFPDPVKHKGRVLNISSEESLGFMVKYWNGNSRNNPVGGVSAQCKFCEPNHWSRAKARHAQDEKLRGRSYWKKGPEGWDLMASWEAWKERMWGDSTTKP